MKVKDLIKKLVEMPMEAEVWLPINDMASTVELVILSPDEEAVTLRKLSI
jgi:hypothetical protein